MKGGEYTRIGHGYDVHVLTEGRKLIIGGVEIPYEKGLLGHSDADVLLHAVSDALLGAAAMGDIGGMFPDDDPKFEGADSLVLLKQVVSRLKKEGYSVGKYRLHRYSSKAKNETVYRKNEREYCVCLRNGYRQNKRQSNHRRKARMHGPRRGDFGSCGLHY